MKKLVVLAAVLFSFSSYAQETAHDSEMEDKALTEATETMVSEPVDKTPTSTPDSESKDLPTQEGEDSTRKKENEIPVFREAHAKAEKPQSMWGRLLMSLVVVAAVAGGLIFATRRWAKAKNTVGGQAKVKVSHQLHLGPKKSIALIEVAGEHLLIGVTDHNINLLKTLSIINDEIPENVPHSFEDVLQEDFEFAKNLDVRIR